MQLTGELHKTLMMIYYDRPFLNMVYYSPILPYSVVLVLMTNNNCSYYTEATYLLCNMFLESAGLGMDSKASLSIFQPTASARSSMNPNINKLSYTEGGGGGGEGVGGEPCCVFLKPKAFANQ